MKSTTDVRTDKPSDGSQQGDHAYGSQVVIDAAVEKSYVRKMDYWLLPFMSIMYFFNAVDRSNLGNAETDGMSKDLGFVGEQYSLLILLFYIPNGLCDLPLNLLTKRFSGRIILPALMVGWGAMALLQAACKNFGGMLAIRLILGAFEAGFFAGAVFYLTLFYTRGELGFRIAIFFGSALLASAFSGLISFGVFRIQDPHVHGWMWLFIIEGALTVLFGIVAFWWLPANAQTAWFLDDAEREVASLILLAAIDAQAHVGVAYFACFLLAGGAYIPSSLVHSWHNNNNLSENSRAATTGLLVGLGNLGGILSAATFRTTYAPRYAPTLIATAGCNVVCIFFVLCLGMWMRRENARKNKEQGMTLTAQDVETRDLRDGEKDPRWRFFI
ncbi:hypothetical protein COL26b_011865 [Colletotrichum chrysophilum]|uniref:uncharacterized protein n=1 Tax=Colletotrichum chrysophilum TaxID=1836956 RepID=UPI0023017E6B|nr:uncharacterized protein COL26b_011865 [Colletotrichum chrysophilum]KAJ0365965.1 hypothetical protein COL26b_011865 [Colletotrichum chrysophilum]